MEYNKYIDHTLLAPTATEAQIRKLCAEALQNDFASVCVNGDYVPLAASLLHKEGSTVKVCTVIGFPLGAMSVNAKVGEAREAIFDGADEVDMVINISWLKDHKYDAALDEVRRVRNACPSRIILKVIIECCLLTDDEKVEACKICKQAGADFVKTSTGFSTGGATVHDVELMKKTVGSFPHIKAAGGIRDRKMMLDLIKAGADRIGTSHGIELMKE